MRVLWKQERQRFLKALTQLPRHKERNRALMLVAYDTGCRVAELCALDVDDYDDQRRSLHVINIKAQGHPKREIPLHAATARALRAWLRKRPADCDTQAMFVSQKGKRICDRQVRNIYAAVCSQAGIENQGIHTLRHTMATRLLDEHILDIHQVSRRLGHRDIMTTYRYYVHGSVEEEAKAIHNHRL